MRTGSETRSVLERGHTLDLEVFGRSLDISRHLRSDARGSKRERDRESRKRNFAGPTKGRSVPSEFVGARFSNANQQPA